MSNTRRFGRGALVAGLLMGVMQAGAVAQVLNAGFESGSGSSIPSWTQWGSARVETWAAKSGTNGLAMYGWASFGGVYQDVAARGVSNYSFAAFGYRDTDFSTQLVVELKLEFLTSNNVLLASAAKVVNGPAAWSQQTVAAVSPPGTDKVRPVLLFNGVAGAGGAYKWDDVSLASSAVSSPTNTHFVSPTGGNIYPYTNWATAAQSIQAAVYAAGNGDLVLVTNGTYTLSSQITVDRSVTIRSVNGAASAVVNGANTVRCFYVTATNVTLNGLTISNGNAYASVPKVDGGGSSAPAGGGGISAPGGGKILNCAIVNNKARSIGGGIEMTAAGVISNCVIAGNSAQSMTTFFYYNDPADGGGIFASGNILITRCLISNNTASIGYGAFALESAVGGGVYLDSATLSDCRVTDNSATSTNGGGRYGPGAAVGAGVFVGNAGSIRGCEIVRNYNNATSVGSYGSGASGSGAGVYASPYWTGVIESSTIADNTNVTHPASYGSIAGFYSGATSTTARVVNTILHFNVTKKGAATTLENWGGSSIAYSNVCTTPLPAGPGHLQDDPHLLNRASGDYRLVAGSSCIDRGVNQAWMSAAKDLAGTNRIYNTTVDIGAYEFSSVGGFNLLLNGNLERREVWIRGGDLNHEGWAARNGTNGLAMYGWTGNSGYAYQDVGAGSATTYTFSIWGYKDAAFDAGVQKPELKVEFFNSSFTMLGAVTNAIASAPAAWTKFTLTGNKPAGATVVRAVLVFSAPASGGAFKWDDAQLVAGGVAGAMRAAASTGKVSEPEAQPETTVVAPAVVAPAPQASVSVPAVSSDSKPARRVRGHRGGRAAASMSSATPVGVLTSDGKSGADGRAAIDGNAATAWVGRDGARGWWIALTYGKTVKVRDVQVDLVEGSASGALFLYSSDAKNWEPLSVDLYQGAVDLGYLWVIFPADASGAVPKVKEIRVQQAR